MAEDPLEEVHVTPQADAAQAPLVGKAVTEEKIEYRDENGKLLNDDEVKALQGQVSFSTRYETKTRLIDEYGNEIANYNGGEAPVPAKAEGEDPKTAPAAAIPAAQEPAKNDAKEDVKKEAKAEFKAEAEPESPVAAPSKEEL